MRRKTRGRWVGGALLVPFVVGGCGTGEAEEAPAIQTVVAERGSLRITAEATGSVEPIRKVEVKSKAGGEILDLHVEVGDDVAPGTLLAEIDPRDVRNAYEQAEADLDVAEARAEIAANQLRRQEQLREGGVITEQELESARLEDSNARANLIKARTNLELAELRLGDVTIRAPMAGTILEKQVEDGQVIQSASGNVSGGTTLFVMADLGEMQVRTLVDETDMGEIRAGMPADVAVEAFPDRRFQGTVSKIEPQAVVQSNVTMFPVIVGIDNRDGLLKPGMNAEVEILIDQASDVLLVPNGAVVTPQDVGSAALALGLDLDDVDFSSFRGMGRFGAAAGPGGGRGGGAREGGAPAERPTGEAAGGGVRDRRAPAAGRRPGPGAAGDRPAGRGVRPGVGPAGGQAGGPAGVQGERRTRPAVVFVMDAQGTPTPTRVEIGLSDWDYTQIVSGLEEGAELAVVGTAQLQAQQQEFMNRIRQRTGGPFGGGR